MPNRQHRSHRHIPLFLILTIYWSTGHSDDDLTAFTESYFYDDLPVVLSASRLAQSQADTPTAMTIIDKKMIQASAALNLPDLLRLVPGFTIGFLSDASITVSYHGHADEYARDMQVLIDGRSIYDPVYGGIPWSEIPLSLDEILRIEVIRGPNAAAYGSNSYAGVINVVTDHPADLLGTSFSTTFGYEKTRYVEAAHAASNGKLDYRLSTSYKEAEGFENRDDSSRARWLKFDSDYKFDIDNTIRTTFGTSHGNYDEGLPTLLQSERELDNRYNYQSIEWNRVLSEKSKLNIQFYHNYYSVDDLKQTPRISEQISAFDELSAFDEAVRPDIFAAAISGGRYDFDSLMNALNLTDSPLLFSWLGLKSHRYDLEVEHTTEPMDDFRIVWGIGARHDRGESFWLLHSNQPVSRDLYRLFLNSEWYATQKFVINAGGMLEKFEGKERIFSPRLGFNYHLNPSNTLRISGSRAYRMPTIYEDNAHITIQLGAAGDDFNNWVIGTEDLDPQQIDRIEAGYFGNFTEHGLTVDLCVFRESYSDIIDQYRNFDYPDPDRGVTDPFNFALLNEFHDLYQQGAFTYTNFGDVDINGLEFELDYRPTVRDMVYFGFSYLDISGNEIKRLKNGIFSFRENAEEKIPKRTFSLIASHAFDDGLTMSTAYYFTDEMEWPGEGDAVPNYSRVDLKFNKHINLANTNIDISLLLQNLHKKNFDFYHNDRIDSHNIWNKRIYLQAKIAL
ncbi:MAG: TonB-dependent receptor [Candidatus Thiodiazotropha sp. (ex Rostrolucina anterorostrata)]|nr:TonB-dependent receptor [Candidatus Thiodiazotropha sp. (ex Rostrolucina anterorostrata)]